MNIFKNTTYYHMLSVFTTLLYHALIILNNSGEKIVIDVEVAIKIKLFYFADHLFCFYQLVNVTALVLRRPCENFAEEVFSGLFDGIRAKLIKIGGLGHQFFFDLSPNVGE